MKLLLLCALAPVVIAYTEDEETQWFLFQIQYEKNYHGEDEKQCSKEIFMDNLRFIREHNMKYDSKEVTFSLGINQFADLENKVFLWKTNCVEKPANLADGCGMAYDSLVDNIPKSFDWRIEGAVTPAKDQGDCRSCWAFSVVGSLEGQYFTSTRKLISLSEQNVIDCSPNQLKCRSQRMSVAYDYLVKTGIDSEAKYPYTGKEGKCKYNPIYNVTSIKDCYAVSNGDEMLLQQSVYSRGPISVLIRKWPYIFQLYKAGRGGYAYHKIPM